MILKKKTGPDQYSDTPGRPKSNSIKLREAKEEAYRLSLRKVNRSRPGLATAFYYYRDPQMCHITQRLVTNIY